MCSHPIRGKVVLISDNEKAFTKKYIDFLNTNKSEQKDSVLRNSITRLAQHLNEKITKKWQELQGSKRAAALKEIHIHHHVKERNQDKILTKISYEIIVKSERGNEYTLAERSKGCQWFFAFMLFTEFRKHRNPNTVFLLDEPASNLHAEAQEKIMKAINELTPTPQTSVIYTTHSPYLLDAGNLDTAYVAKNLTTSETGFPNIELTRFSVTRKMKTQDMIDPSETTYILRSPMYWKAIEGLQKDGTECTVENIEKKLKWPVEIVKKALPYVYRYVVDALLKTLIEKIL